MNDRQRFRGLSTFLSPRDADWLRLALLARRAWGDWLSGFPWDHFATLTFRHPASRPAAIRNFSSWRRRLEQRAQERVFWFYALERGAAGLLHLHALVSGTRPLQAGSVADAWSWGRADASAYDPARGAAYYVTKAVASDAVEYSIDPPPRPRLLSVDRPSAPHSCAAALDLRIEPTSARANTASRQPTTTRKDPLVIALEKSEHSATSCCRASLRRT